MTMGIGVQCDEGVVALTDSIQRSDAGPDTPTVVSLARGFRWLPGARLAVIASGSFPQGSLDEACTQLRHEANPDVAAHQLFASLVSAMRDGIDAAREWMSPEELVHSSATGPHLLCGGGLVGEVPRLWRFDPLRGPEQSMGPAVYCVGSFANTYAASHGLEKETPPVTLKQCADLALDWARSATRDLYKGRALSEFLAENLIPTWSPPFHLATITADTCTEDLYYR
ncbi:MAG: hypothetical protein ACYDAL_02030 [Candidatus Dormibacteraceae bacterium]